MNLTKNFFNDFKLKNKAIPCLDGTVAFINGQAIQTDLSTTVIKELKDSLPEGVYDLKGLKSSMLSKVEDIENYPILKEVDGKETITVDTATLLRAAEFCENDDLRPFKRFIACINGKIYATNAHKLYHKVVELPDFSIPSEIVTKFCKGKGRETCQINIGKEYSKIVFPDLSVIYRNFDGRFPDFECVIPKDYTKSMTFDSGLIEFEKLKFAANSVIKRAIFTFKDNVLTIRSEDIDLGKEFEQSFPCECEEDFQIGFNIEYLEDCIKGIGEVVMSYSTNSKAVLFGENCLLMPVMNL